MNKLTFTKPLLDKVKSIVDSYKSKVNPSFSVNDIKNYLYVDNREMIVLMVSISGMGKDGYFNRNEYVCIYEDGRVTDCDEIMNLQEKVNFYAKLRELKLNNRGEFILA